MCSWILLIALALAIQQEGSAWMPKSRLARTRSGAIQQEGSAWMPKSRLARTRSVAWNPPAMFNVQHDGNDEDKPILVVGATSRVGRLVVQQLMGRNMPVRAMVKHPEKALALFGTATSLEHPKLEVIVADAGNYDLIPNELDRAVEGCSAIISVKASVRFAKLTDFLPWRLFNYDVSSWAGRNHPYYGNYQGQKHLLELAARHNVTRFVRLSTLGLSFDAFDPLNILKNTLLSLNHRWCILFEQALARNKHVPYVVLRPGGLIDEVRNTTTTNLQVDASGTLPLPARCGRADIAALAIAALSIPPEKSYTLACRWCGETVKPNPQGVKEDGLPTADLCIHQLEGSGATQIPPPTMKPYGAAVAICVYSLPIIAYTLLSSFFSVISRSLRTMWRVLMRILWG